MAAEIQVGIDTKRLMDGKRMFDSVVSDMIRRVTEAQQAFSGLSAPLGTLAADVSKLTKEYKDLNDAIKQAVQSSQALTRVKAPRVTNAPMGAGGGGAPKAPRVTNAPMGAGGGLAPNAPAPRVAGVLQEVTSATLDSIRAGKEQLAVNEKLVSVGSQWFRVSSDMAEQAKLLKRAYESSQPASQKTALLMERLSLETHDATRETHVFKQAQEGLAKQLADRTARETANRGRSLSMLFDELRTSLLTRIPGGSMILNLSQKIQEVSHAADDSVGAGWRMAEAYASAGSRVAKGAEAAGASLGSAATSMGLLSRAAAALPAVATAIALPVGAFAAVATGGVAAALASTDYLAAMTRLRLVSQATDQQMQRFRDTIASLASTGRIVPEDAANGLQDLVSLGFTANEAIQLLPVAMDTAAAAGLGLSESASLVGGVLKGFSLQTDQARASADMLVGASNATAIGFGDLTAAVGKMTKGAVVAKQDLSSMLTTIGLARNASIPIEVAATGVNSALMHMVGAGNKHLNALFGGTDALVDSATGKIKKFEDLLVELAPKIDQLGTVEGPKALVKIFGSEGLAAVAPILAQMQGGIRNANDEMIRGGDVVAFVRSQLEATGGTVEKFANEQMGGLGGQMTRMSNLFTTLINTIGEKFAPVVTYTLSKMNDMLETAVKFTQQFLAGGPATSGKPDRIRLNELIVQRDEVSKKMQEIQASDTRGTMMQVDALVALSSQYQTLTRDIDKLKGSVAATAANASKAASETAKAMAPVAKVKTLDAQKKEEKAKRDAQEEAKKQAEQIARWEQMYLDRQIASQQALEDAAYRMLPEYQQKLIEISQQQEQLRQVQARGYVDALDAGETSLRLEQERVKALMESVSLRQRAGSGAGDYDVSAQLAQQMELSRQMQQNQQGAQESMEYSGGLFKRLFQLTTRLIAAPGQAGSTLKSFGASFGESWQQILKETQKNIASTFSAITNGISAAVGAVSSLLQMVGVDIASVIQKYGTAAGSSMLSKLSGPSMTRMITRYIDGVVSVVETLTSGPVIQSVVSSLVAGLSRLTEILPRVLPDAIVSLVTGLTQAIPELLPALFDAAVALAQGLAEALADPRVSMALGVALGDAFVWLATNGIPILVRIAVSLVGAIATAFANMVRGLLASMLDAIGLKKQAEAVAPKAAYEAKATPATPVSDAYVAASGPRVLRMSQGDSATVYQQGASNDPSRVGALQIEAQWATVDEVRRLRQEMQGLRADLRGRGVAVATRGL